MHQIQIQTDQGRSIPWTPHENAGIACAIVDGETITGATLTIGASDYRISPALLWAFHATGRDGLSTFAENYAQCGFLDAIASAVRDVRNHHHCSDCAVDWEDRWSCEVDDDCPGCGTSHSPLSSDVLIDIELDADGIYQLVRVDDDGVEAIDASCPLLSDFAFDGDSPSPTEVAVGAGADADTDAAIAAMRECLYKVETQLLLSPHGIDALMSRVMLADVERCSAIATAAFGPR
ncbi:MAG: hypothetical protein IPO08_19170 [Xanthomonadales bacterium]|nr:hypothetical protein [Xanthomonadales bacterium]